LKERTYAITFVHTGPKV